MGSGNSFDDDDDVNANDGDDKEDVSTCAVLCIVRCVSIFNIINNKSLSVKLNPFFIWRLYIFRLY